MKHILTFTLLILAIGLAAFEYDVIDELPMGGDLSDCLSLDIDYPYMYAASRYGLEIYEIDSQSGSLTKLTSLAIAEHANSIVKRGDFVYILKSNPIDYNSPESSMLFKIDVTDVQDPAIVLSTVIDLPMGNYISYVTKLQAFDNALWFSNVIDYTYVSISLVDPENLEIIATLNDFYGFNPIQNNRAIAMVNEEDQLYTIYDFSDPANYYEVGMLTLNQTEETWGSFEPYGDHYVVQIIDTVLILYDTIDILNWQLVSTVNQTELVMPATFCSVIGEYLFVPKSIGIEIFNLADVANPYSVGFFPVDPSYFYPIFLNNCNVVNWQNHIYWGTIFDGIFHYTFEDELLSLIDTCCPEYMLMYSPIKDEEHYITISAGTGLDTFTIENSSIYHQERILTECDFYQMDTLGDYILARYYTDQNPSVGFFSYENGAITQESSFLMPEGAWFYVNPSELTVFYVVNYFDHTIRKYSFEDITNITEVWQITAYGYPAQFTFIGDFMYAAGNNVLYVFSGFESNNPVHVTTINAPFSSDDFGIQNIEDYLIVSMDTCVEIYSVSTPENLQLLSHLDAGNDVSDVRKHGSYLYVPCYYALHVYDVSDYDNPIYLGYIPLNSQYRDIVFYEENGVEKAIIQQAECLTMVTIQPTEAGEPVLPVVECTLANYPNPFNPETTIYFETTNAHESAQIEIFNAKGQKVKQLQMTNDELRAGSVHWDGTDSANQPVTSGVYLYQLKAGGKTLGQKKCLLLK